MPSTTTLKFMFFIFGSTICLHNVIAITYYSRADGDWDNGNTWSTAGFGGAAAGTFPVAVDEAYISGHEIEVINANAAASQVVMYGTGDDSKLLIYDAFILSVSGNFRIDGNGGSDKCALNLKKKNTANGGILNVFGFFLAQKNNQDDEIEIKAEHTSAINVTSNFILDYDSGDGKIDLELKDNSTLRVNGFFLAQKTGGDEKIDILFQDDAIASIALNMDFLMTGGTKEIDFEAKDDVRVNVGGDLNLTYTAGNDEVNILFKNDAILDVEQDLEFDANAANKAIMELEDDVYLYLAGSFIRNPANRYGIFNCKDDGVVVEMDGSVYQVIGEDDGAGTDFFLYENMVVNNTYGTIPQLATEGLTTIHESLTLSDGIVQATSANILVIPDKATSSEGNPGSFISGPMRKVGDDDFVFPLGKGTTWARLTIANYGGNNNAFDAEYFDSPYVDVTNKETVLYSVSALEYWNLERSNDDGGEPEVTLFWEDADQSQIYNLGTLIVAQYDLITDMEWKDRGQGVTSGGIGAGISGSITASAPFTQFGPITLSTYDGGNILPIELISFEARNQGDVVQLEWVTETEHNSDYFEIQRSTDGASFQTFARKEGAGNSSVTRNYTIQDKAATMGKWYYRLKQVDRDGTYEYSELVMIDVNARSSFVENSENIAVYPNPVRQGDYLKIGIPNTNGTYGTYSINIYDMSGKLTYSQQLNDLGSSASLNMAVNEGFVPGVYILVIRTPDSRLLKEKFVVSF